MDLDAAVIDRDSANLPGILAGRRGNLQPDAVAAGFRTRGNTSFATLETIIACPPQSILVSCFLRPVPREQPGEPMPVQQISREEAREATDGAPVRAEAHGRRNTK